jgi:hypothetical protein
VTCHVTRAQAKVRREAVRCASTFHSFNGDGGNLCIRHSFPLGCCHGSGEIPLLCGKKALLDTRKNNLFGKLRIELHLF